MHQTIEDLKCICALSTTYSTVSCYYLVLIVTIIYKIKCNFKSIKDMYCSKYFKTDYFWYVAWRNSIMNYIVLQ